MILMYLQSVTKAIMGTSVDSDARALMVTVTPFLGTARATSVGTGARANRCVLRVDTVRAACTRAAARTERSATM